MSEEKLRERLQLVLREKDYSCLKLAGGIASVQSKLSKQINQGTTISAETVMLVLATFPDISAEWLLRGEGSMLKTNSGNSVSVDTMSGGQVVAGSVGKVVGNESKDDILNKVLEQNSMLIQLILHGKQ